MWNRRKLAYLAGGAAAFAALAWAFAPRPVQVETGMVERGRFEQAIEEDGRTRLRERYTVSAPVAARLARIALREGDPVKAGETVAILTPVMSAMVDERSMREASARLKAADAGVAGAAARVDRARVGLDEAQLEMHRFEKLAREGFLATSRLDSARLALDGARKELEAAQASREVAVQERAQAAAVLQPSGKAGGSPLILKAPASGVVLRVALLSEATVAAGAPLLDIGDPRQLEVVAELLTTDAMQAQPGARAVIERWGGPPVQARVRRVEPAAFTKVSALGIEEQRVNVLLDAIDPPGAWSTLGDGFRVSVRVLTATADDAVTVPVGALFPYGDGGGMAAYRIDDGRARLQPVELAGRNANIAWVRAGLQPGQPVIVYPPPTVVEGKRVQVRRP